MDTIGVEGISHNRLNENKIEIFYTPNLIGKFRGKEDSITVKLPVTDPLPLLDIAWDNKGRISFLRYVNNYWTGRGASMYFDSLGNVVSKTIILSTLIGEIVKTKENKLKLNIHFCTKPSKNFPGLCIPAISAKLNTHLIHLIRQDAGI